MASPEVDWDRLDKTKVFFVGIPLFSAVTTGLYPLTVVKTRQMASHGVPGGLGGSFQTAAAIWRADGIRGFYRGFGTVVFGTIPGRTVYLTTLELTKNALQRNDALMQSMAPSALAGASNFIAGGVASLATQLVAVPVDVVSQRLMVHGADLGVGVGASGSGGGAGGSGGASGGGAGGGAAAGAAAQQRRGICGFGAARPRLASPVLAEARQRLGPWVAAGAPQHGPGAWRARPAPFRRRALSGAAGGGGGGGGAAAATTAAAPAAALQRMNGLTMTRLIVQQEGLRGLWRGLIPSAALYVPNSAIWWGCFGGWQSVIWLTLHPELAAAEGGGGGGDAAAAGASTGEIVAVQTAAAVLAGACSAVLTTPLDVLKTRLQVSGGAAGGGGSSSNGSSSGSSGGGGGVAARASWGSILRELLREEGVRGLWRGLAPRMASSSIFGVCMTGTYMQLKRWCAIDPV